MYNKRRVLMNNRISLEIARKFGIEDIDFDVDYTRDVLKKLRGEYMDTDPTYATMVDNMYLLNKEGDKRFISEYLNIIEYLFTSDKISEQDKSVFLADSYYSIFTLHSFMASINKTIISYKDHDDSIIGQYINKWKSSDNKYLRSIAACKLVSSSYLWRYGLFNIDIDQILTKIRDNNSIETIARSFDEEYYKLIMVNILKYLDYNLISYKEDEALIKAIGDDCEDLMVYNKDSNDIYDVLIRANAYRLMRFNLYKRYITYIEDKTEKDFPTHLYMYIDENIFYECEISDSSVCKKLDNGGYLTSGYCIDSMGYEKEWFMNNPDCDCIYIDETPEFYEPINIPQFDITFNSDPNLFEDAIILYGSREEAKKAFLERNK